MAIKQMQKIQKTAGSLVVIVLFIGLVLFAGETPEGEIRLSQARQEENIISGAFDKSKFKSDEQWREILAPEQYRILRKAGTEIPFTGELNFEKRRGTYYSVGCGVPVFRSETKYDSGTGWPSFTAPINDNAVVLRRESDPGDDRIEVLDPCGGHLGHVFDDGPPPTGKRYCINSLALRFVPDEE